MAVEVVLVAPVLVLTLLLIVGAARIADARSQVGTAAYDAARAASLAGGSGAARAGVGAARASLAERGLSCVDIDVAVDTARMFPGGQVRASVTCVVKLDDLSVPGVPGSRTIRADAVVPVEEYRW